MSLSWQCIICRGRNAIGTGSCPLCICNFNNISIDQLLDKQMEYDKMSEEEIEVWNAYIRLELAKKEFKKRFEEFGLAKKQLENNRIHEMLHGD